MNVDTDTQFAYLIGIRVSGLVWLLSPPSGSSACFTRTQDFITKKKDYLQTQVGNPDGADKPNKKVIPTRFFFSFFFFSFCWCAIIFFIKKFYDPRVWVREGEKTLSERVKEACKDLGNVSRL